MQAILSTFGAGVSTTCLRQESHLEELKKQLTGKRIVVISFGVNGFGDFLCAQKICLYLHETLGVDLKHLALASNANESQKKIFAVRDLTLLDETVASITQWNPQLQIFAPVADDYLVTPRLSVGNKIATIAVAEYGFDLPTYSVLHKNLSAHAFGFKASQLGYIPSPKLRTWAATKTDLSPEVRLKPLLELPPGIRTAILGSEDSLSSFVNRSKLYFAYAKNNSEIYSFVTAVARMNTKLKDKRNLTFFVLGSALMSPGFIKANLKGNTCYHFDTCFRMLKEDGFSSIKLVDPTSRSAAIPYILSSEHQKTITLVGYPLEAAFVHNLIMASEEETLVTGDQSFSECLSAEKFPIYEVFIHKLKLYQDFMALFPAEIALVLEIHGPIKTVSKAFLGIDIDKLSYLLVFQKQNPQFAQTLKSSLAHIAAAYDFSEQFSYVLLKALKSVSSEESLEALPKESMLI